MELCCKLKKMIWFAAPKIPRQLGEMLAEMGQRTRVAAAQE
jgi:hypothetical protein